MAKQTSYHDTRGEANRAAAELRSQGFKADVKQSGGKFTVVAEKQATWRRFRRTRIAIMRPWVEGLDMTRVSVSDSDREAGSPKEGDYIAKNPQDPGDQWLVSAQYAADNFEEIGPE